MVDEVLLGHWIDENDQVTELISVATGRVGDREHVAYRFRLENAGVSYIVEQQAYYMVSGGRIDWLRILCSGTRPDPKATSVPGRNDMGPACLLPEGSTAGSDPTG